MAEYIILGAGKIARGFIAHLLFLAGRGFAFVKADAVFAGKLEECDARRSDRADCD